MRIISADGKWDILYDSAIIWWQVVQTGVSTMEYVIYARAGDQDYLMASYSKGSRMATVLNEMRSNYDKMDISTYRFPQDSEATHWSEL